MIRGPAVLSVINKEILWPLRHTIVFLSLLMSWDILMSSLWCKISVISPDRLTKTSANKYNRREKGDRETNLDIISVG